MNKYIIFVHGLTGKVGKTWGDFPRFLVEDPTFKEYKVIEFGYYSPFLAWFKPAPSIGNIANGVLSDINRLPA